MKISTKNSFGFITADHPTIKVKPVVTPSVNPHPVKKVDKKKKT